jgi:hypothetical protein
MAILTKYVSVTFTGGSNDGSAANPYTTIEAARSDINDNLGSDVGPHYIILSESSGATTTYSSSYGMPANREQALWIGDYDYGIIVSGAHGQDIIIDGTDARDKSAFVIYGSGSGIHNVTITGYGTMAVAGYGVIKANNYPSNIKGVTLYGNDMSGITFIGDRADTGGLTIVDSCKIHLKNPGQTWGIATTTSYNPGHILVNNCLITFSGSSGGAPTAAIYIHNGNTSQSTASFNTFVAKIHDDNTLFVDSGFGITADLAKNNIVSMSLPNDTVRPSWINADTVSNNFYAGYNSQNVTDGVRRLADGTSASFDSTDLDYKRDSSALTLFKAPDINTIYADWTLAAGSPALNAGVALSFVTLDLSGAVRADPPDMGAFEALGYPNTIITVIAGSLGKVLDVVATNILKVIGT